MNIKAQLYSWRDAECARKGVEAFRILPNTTLDEIALKLPKDKDELCLVKGIKEMKFAQYGKEILQILNGESVTIEAVKDVAVEKPLTVSQYLNIINIEIGKIQSRIKGEVVTFQISGNAIYFTIKDSENDSVLSVFMWASDYRISGITITTGLEVIVEGHSEIYKPNGKFSLRANTIELIGEGSLKVAYDKLKKKLDDEGLFDEKVKIKIKEFPTNIGVITSKQGAVIHDFLNNLGKFGFNIKFVDSRVEGVLATKDILSSIERMSHEKLDALVIIRGGGSLESLQAFNNEYVVRAISKVKIPVICAIGHDKDVPLAQMVADYAPSTPSICTSIINESWNTARFHVESYNNIALSSFSKSLQRKINTVTRTHGYLGSCFSEVSNRINYAINCINTGSQLYQQALYAKNKEVNVLKNNLINIFPRLYDSSISILGQITGILDAYDPMRQLKLGYSLIYSKEKILKSVSNIQINDTISAELVDGTIVANITKINLK